MDTFVTRQPVFDRALVIRGYELLHRQVSPAVALAAGETDPQVTTTTIAEVLAGVGMDRLTGGRTAFLAVDEDTLRSGTLLEIPPEDVVLELPGSLLLLPEAPELLGSLRKRGFGVAAPWHPGIGDVLPHADVVKVDVSALGPERTSDVAGRLHGFGGELMAARVETAGMHELCVKEGFQLFQGIHYFRLQTLSRRDLSTESVGALRLLSLLRDEDAPDARILEAFRSDPALSFKLLRMVNSAALGGRGVQSLEYALRLMGREPLYRWISLLVVRSQGDGSGPREELVRSSLLRARMCELVGESVGSAFTRSLPPRGALFLVGLLSRMDALLGAPLAEVAEQLPLAREVKEALVERRGSAGLVLDAVEAYEEGLWDSAEGAVEEVGADSSRLADHYLEAVAWARDRMTDT